MDKDVSRHGQKWLAFWSKNYLAVTPLKRDVTAMHYLSISTFHKSGKIEA